MGRCCGRGLPTMMCNPPPPPQKEITWEAKEKEEIGTVGIKEK